MKRAVLLALLSVAAICFAVLGIWQLERRAWKLDLIARVEARIHASPVAIPPLDQNVDVRRNEYRRVRLTGRFQHDRTTLVDALTLEGAGFWVLTPLQTGAGLVLVNRGFVPAARRNDYARPSAPMTVIGLLRMTEPDGRFLRRNRPDANLWYSRDVAAIARARNLGAVAPFFVDAERTSGYPLGGLTVVNFRNTHLIYALTWFGLAAMAAFGIWRLRRGG